MKRARALPSIVGLLLIAGCGARSLTDDSTLVGTQDEGGASEGDAADSRPSTMSVPPDGSKDAGAGGSASDAAPCNSKVPSPSPEASIGVELAFQPPFFVTTDMGDAQLVAIGDLDGDGRSDVAALGSGFHVRNTLSVFYQNCRGHLSNGETYALEEQSPLFVETSLGVADVNGDGRDDLVVGTPEGFGVAMQTPNGTLGKIERHVVGDQTISGQRIARLADVDGDGRADIVVIDTSNHLVWVVRQNTKGALEDPVSSPAGPLPVGSFAVGDLNGDGAVDIAIIDGQDHTENIAVLLQDRPLHFSPGPKLAVPGTGTAAQVLVADLNGDGKKDLLAYDGSSALYLYPQNDAGGLDAPGTFQSKGGIIATGDVDGDGRIDIVMIGSSSVGVIRHAPNGGFLEPQIIPTPGVVAQCTGECGAMGDLNGDGRPDIVIGSTNGAAILLGAASILRP